MNDEQLTQSERESLDSLPRERIPDHRLKKRTIAALRSQGILRKPARRGITLSPAWVAVAAAVTIALVAGGFAMGQWAGSRQTAQAMLAMHEQDGLRLAAEVQRTGTAYITALNTLVENLNDQDAEVQTQGRQVAISALYAAADLVVNIAPDEPVAQNILWALDQSEEAPAEQPAQRPKHFVYF
jgi:hypothetical protein